jgi:hypothetical protein
LELDGAEIITWKIFMNRVLLELALEEIRRLFNLLHNHEGIKMSVTLQDTQEVTLTLGLKDSVGNAGIVEAVPVWSVDDATIASVTPAADGLSAVVAAVGLGAATVSVLVNGITQTLGVTVVGGDATQISINVGTPVAIPVSVAAATTDTSGASTDTTGAVNTTGDAAPVDTSGTVTQDAPAADATGTTEQAAQ